MIFRTYKAVLTGDRIEWTTDSPRCDAPTPVEVTVLEAPTDEAARGRAMAEALRRLAEARAASTPADPVAWQREVRRDRPLPGRGG